MVYTYLARLSRCTIYTQTVKTLRPQTITRTVATTKIVTLTNYPPDVTNTITETVSPVVTQWTVQWKTKVETSTGQLLLPQSTYLDATFLVELLCIMISFEVTVESQIPVASEYAACGSSSSLATTANGGNSIYNIMLSGDTPYSMSAIGGIADEVECCVECMKKPLCLGSLVTHYGSMICYHFVVVRANTCPNGQL